MPYVESFLQQTETLFKYDIVPQEIKEITYWMEIAQDSDFSDFIKNAILIAYTHQWLSNQVPENIVVVDEEKKEERPNYEEIVDYLTRRFLPVYWKKAWYIYDAEKGIWKENTYILEHQTRRLFVYHFPDDSSRQISRKVTEVMNRLLWQSAIDAVEYPFNAFTGDFVPLRNGVWWISKEILLPHSPLFLWTYQIPWAYQSEAECPRIDKFLHEIVDESDVPLLFEIPATILLQNPAHQRAYMLFGEGNNGKSTYLSLITELLGRENIANVSLQDLVHRRFA
ncbi:MAG: hypothetical protein J7L47_06960, partial [Candidatus Odinarchaeota archaeon]|nr:hypothetical protein [Candidatus Odinarchaeota archaeon]